MGAKRYEDLVCWQLSNDLKLRIYAITDALPAAKDFRYCDQIRESARSAPSNIAEGFGRFHPADFARFLEIARGSLIETHNHLRDGLDRRYLTAVECRELCALADRASAATTRLRSYLDRCSQGRRCTPR